MSYVTGEKLILAQIQALSTYSTANSGRGNWSMLNSGKSATYAILKCGESPQEFISRAGVQDTWRTIIQVWQRYKNGSYDSLLDNVASIVNRINQYPHLGGGEAAITDSNVRRRGDVQEMWLSSSTPRLPAWLRQDITVEWIEQTIITFKE